MKWYSKKWTCSKDQFWNFTNKKTSFETSKTKRPDLKDLTSSNLIHRCCNAQMLVDICGFHFKSRQQPSLTLLCLQTNQLNKIQQSVMTPVIYNKASKTSINHHNPTNNPPTLKKMVTQSKKRDERRHGPEKWFKHIKTKYPCSSPSRQKH